MKRARRRRGGPGTRTPRAGLSLELLECRLALAGFTAYNGLFPSANTHPHMTLFADSPGHTAAGPLVDIATGEATGVLLTTSQVGVNFGGDGYAMRPRERMPTRSSTSSWIWLPEICAASKSKRRMRISTRLRISTPAQHTSSWGRRYGATQATRIAGRSSRFRVPTRFDLHIPRGSARSQRICLPIKWHCGPVATQASAKVTWLSGRTLIRERRDLSRRLDSIPRPRADTDSRRRLCGWEQGLRPGSHSPDRERGRRSTGGGEPPGRGHPGVRGHGRRPDHNHRRTSAQREDLLRHDSTVEPIRQLGNMW